MERLVVHIGVYNGLADWEVGYATAHISRDEWQRQPGRYRVRTVGRDNSPITTMGGLRIVPDVSLDELSPAGSAMLILPGSDEGLTGGLEAFANKAAELLAEGVPVAAICGATAALALVGLLDDRSHTSNAPEFLNMTAYRGADRYVAEPAVRDGDLITASGIAPVEFARLILDCLGVYDPPVLEAWYALYGLRDPAGYVELMAATSRRGR
ncbi:MAG: DJ-1/PfpI family protein [Planctomycetota bacterium]|jgi:putative intracellular protease/amidase